MSVRLYLCKDLNNQDILDSRLSVKDSETYGGKLGPILHEIQINQIEKVLVFGHEKLKCPKRFAFLNKLNYFQL